MIEYHYPKHRSEVKNGAIGIDRCILTGFRVAGLDIKRLNGTNVSYTAESNGMSMSMHGVPVYRIYVSGQSFSLDIGVKVSPKQYLCYYCQLDLSKKSINLQNETIDQLHDRVCELLESIYDRYGILLDCSAARFKRIEINSTFSLSGGRYEDYRIPLKIIQKNLPNLYKTRQPVEDNGLIGTLYAKYASGDQSIKIYNKTRQLKDIKGFDARKNIMRFEYTLSGESIEQCIGSDLLTVIKQEQIESFWLNRIDEDVICPFERWNSGRIKRLHNLLPARKGQWIDAFLARILNAEADGQIDCLSYHDLAQILRNDGDKNPYRTIARIIKSAEQIGCDAMLDGSRAEKLDEILTSVSVTTVRQLESA